MCSTRMRSFSGKGSRARHFLLQHALGDADVADELAFEGVAEAGLPVQLADLADVVQDGAGDEQVGVDLGIERRGGEADADEREDVLQQAADPGVVQHLGGGSRAVGSGDRGVVEEGEDQALEVGVGEARDVAAQLVPHLVDIEVGDGKIVGGVDLGLGGEAQLLQRDLELALILRDLALHLDVAALGAGCDGVGEVLPHDGRAWLPVLSVSVR